MAEQEQREIVVEIGPFKEWQNGNTLTGMRIVSNGDLNTMKIKVHVEKSYISVPNHSRIQIWNLSHETRKRLTTGGLFVKLYAGTQNGNKELLFTGAVAACITQRSGTDIITTLVCQTREATMLRTIVSKSWEKDVPVDTVVHEIVNMIPNVIYNPQNNKIEGKIGYKGFSVFGGAQFALDKLAKQFGFSWNIDNSVFNAVMDGKPKSSGILLDKRSGLRSVSPRLSGFDQIQEGVDVIALYRQNVITGHTIRIESEVSPELSGNYVCHTIEYDLCPKESTWDMNIHFFVLVGAEQ